MDLDAILRTLASLPKPEGHQSDLVSQQPYGQSLSFENAQPDSVHGQAVPQTVPQHQVMDPRLAGRPTPSQLPLPKSQVRSSTPLIDPSTIIDWKQGLRCVSKIAAQNPQFASSVRKLVKDQEGNVRQWEAGRTRLIEEQAMKKENEQTHRAAL